MITINANKSWQDIDVANEILLYYNYTARLLGISVKPDVTNAATVRDFVADMQSALTSGVYYGRAVNPDASFDNLSSTTDYPDDYSVLGLSQLYEDAGITSGFRRCTTKPADWTNYNDAAFAYGSVQDGDLIGPWIFKDLQDLLHAIRVFKITDIVRRDAWSVNDSDYVNEDANGNYTDNTQPWADDPPAGCIDADYANVANYTDIDELGAWYYGSYFLVNGVPESFSWYWKHRRFGLMAKTAPTNQGVKQVVKFYARVVPANGQDFWSYPYGSASTNTKQIGSTEYKNETFYRSDLLGGNRITDAASLYPDRPDSPDEIGGKGVRLEDVTARVEVNWFAIGSL